MTDKPRVEPSVSEPARPKCKYCNDTGKFRAWSARLGNHTDTCDCAAGKGVIAPQPTPEPPGWNHVRARCEKCGRIWTYDRRERLGADRPICPDCEPEAAPQGVGKLKIAGRGEAAESEQNKAGRVATGDRIGSSSALDERPAIDSVEGVGKLSPEWIAVSERDLIEQLLDAVICVYWQDRYGKMWDETLTLRAELQQARRERDLAIAHDRQPYPTAEAYEAVCAARTKWQDRAEKAEAENAELRSRLQEAKKALKEATRGWNLMRPKPRKGPA